MRPRMDNTIVFHERLQEPCNKFFKKGDTVLVKMTLVPASGSSGVSMPEAFASSKESAPRRAEVIYAGKKFITVRYERNPKPYHGGFAPTETLNWTESFDRFDLARGYVSLYDRRYK